MVAAAAIAAAAELGHQVAGSARAAEFARQAADERVREDQQVLKHVLAGL